MEEAVRIYQQGDRQQAALLAKRVLEKSPSNAAANFMLGSCALDNDRPGEALPFLEAAAQLDAANPSIRRALGMAQLALRNWKAAAASLELALRSRPQDSDLLNAVGIARSELGELRQALQCYRQAAQLDPQNADIHNNMAIALDQLRDGAAAIRACRESLRINPADAAAWSNMAALLEQANRVDEAAEAAREGLARNPQHADLAVTAAVCTRRMGDAARAAAMLEQLLTRDIRTRTRRTAEFELGHAYDELEDSATAFRHFQAANRLTNEVVPQAAEVAHAFGGELDHMLEYFAPLRRHAWLDRRAAARAGDTPQVAFLVGFPRSGTTLLDTFLGNHPGVTVLEEEPYLERVLHRLRQQRPAYPDALDHEDAAGWDELQKTYRQAISEHVPACPPGGLLLDKNPFMSAHAGFMHALFPPARFLFALRHPCDVVLSCFMQSFTGTAIVGSFVTLEAAAQTYGRVMDLWLRYRELCDLQACELRYENLVREPSGTLRAAFGFLGLDWQPAFGDHTAHARARGRIYTPSYAQVAQPIHARSVSRWKRYADQLGPALERLRPYVERFGYTL